jgi:hypothetical protein
MWCKVVMAEAANERKTVARERAGGLRGKPQSERRSPFGPISTKLSKK